MIIVDTEVARGSRMCSIHLSGAREVSEYCLWGVLSFLSQTNTQLDHPVSTELFESSVPTPCKVCGPIDHLQIK
jgi:hypothetical protein